MDPANTIGSIMKDGISIPSAVRARPRQRLPIPITLTMLDGVKNFKKSGSPPAVKVLKISS